jgi:ribonuclease P protein subunit POP4
LKLTPAILQHELIGLKAEVVRSSNSNCLGIWGRVIDETQKTFTVMYKGKQKVIIKQESVLHFTLADGSVIEVDGRVLIGRPEDRVKKIVRRRW